jgi:hypothetical protein
VRITIEDCDHFDSVIPKTEFSAVSDLKKDEAMDGGEGYAGEGSQNINKREK